MSKRRIIESVKTLLIILLTASALVLIRSIDSFSVIGDRLNLNTAGEGSQTQPSGTGVEMGSTTPAAMAVLLGEGEKKTVAFNGEAVEECYHRFSALFGEALGSAHSNEEITQSQWREVLEEQQGVFIYYRSVQHPEILAAWLGTTVSQTLRGTAGNMFIITGGGEESAWLYYSDYDSGTYYRCATAVSASTLADETAAFQSDGGRFAYETDGLDNVFPYAIIPAETPVVNEIEVSNPLSDSMEMMNVLYRAFDLNSGALHQYEETDGTKVLVEGSKTMRVSPGGKIAFSVGDSRGTAADIVDAVSDAYAAANSIIVPYCAEAELVLISVEKQSGNYHITFDYSVNGVAVELAGGEHAAEFVVGSEGIKEAVINLRCYSYTGAQIYPLPVSLACAVASSENAERIELCYREAGGSMRAAWLMD